MTFIILLLVLAVFIVVLLTMALWIWMLIDCITNEPSEGNDKITWLLVIIFTNWVGALIYYFIRRPKRIATFGK